MGEDKPSIERQKKNDHEADTEGDLQKLSASGAHDKETIETSGQSQGNETSQQSTSNDGDQSSKRPERRETDENKVIPKNDDEGSRVEDELMHEDPHTSFLQPPASDKQQYTTPSKSLPPLKDQETITTPKLFDVAPDNEHSELYNSTQEVASSPIRNDILPHTHDGGILEGESKTALSKFLSIDENTLHGVKNRHILNALVAKAHEFEKLQTQNNQIKSKLEETFTNSRNTISSLQEKYSEADNSLLTLRDENAQLTSKLKKQEVKVKELELSNQQLSVQVSEYKRLSSEKALELRELNEKQSYQEIKHMEKLEELSSANVAQSKKLNQITMEYNRSENEKFAISLQLTKATNEANFLKDQKLWYDEQLKSAQLNYTSLLQKYESEQSQSESKVNRLSVKSESLEQLVKRHEKTISDLEASLKTESAKKSATESKLRSVESKIIEESNANQDLLELTKLQSEQRATRIEQLEAYSEELKRKADENIDVLNSTISSQEKLIDELEEKLERMESALNAQIGDKERILDSNDDSELSRISLPNLFAEYNHVKKQLTVERIQREKLEKELENFVIELDARKPAIANYKDQIQFYETLVSELNVKIDRLRADNVALEKDCKKLKSTGVDYENEIISLKQVVKDLGRQICYFLIHSHIRDNNDEPLALIERSKIEKILDRTGNFDESFESDSDKLVSERLLTFKNIIELRQKNQDLLTAVRQLTRKLENSEEESNNLQAIEEAQEAIMTLDSELEGANAKLIAVTSERDALRKLNTKMADGVVGVNQSVPNIELTKKIEEYESVIKKMKEESADTLKKANEELEKVKQTKNELATQLSVANKSLELTEVRLSTTQKSIDLAVAEKSQVKSELAFWSKQAQKLEDQLRQKSQDLRELQANLAQNNTLLATLQQEKDFANRMQLSLNNELTSLREDKMKLNDLVVNLQAMLRERDDSIKEITAKLNDSTEAAQNLQRKLNEREERLQTLSNQSEKTFKAQNTKLEQINDLSLQLLHLKNEVSEKDKRIVELNARLKDATLNAYSKPEVKQLQEDLKSAGDRLVGLTKLVNDKETAIADKVKTFHEEKTSWEAKYAELAKERKDADDEITTLKKANDDKAQELEKEKEKFVADYNALQRKFIEVEGKAVKFDSLERIYEDRLDDANGKLENEKKTVVVLQSKLDMEAEKNTSLAEEIKTIKDKVVNNEYIITLLKQEKEIINKKLKDLEGELSVSRLDLENERNLAKTKRAELEDQNRLLLDRLELGGTSENGEDGESNNVKQVIEYLRREKEGSDTKLSAVEEENSNLKVKIESMEREITTLHSLKDNIGTLNLSGNEKEQNQLASQLQQINNLKEHTNDLAYEIKRKDAELAKLKTDFTKLKNELDTVKQSSQTQNNQVGIDQQKLRLLEEENARLKAISTNALAKKPEEPKGPPPEIIRMQEQMDKLKNKANDRIKTLKQEHATREKEIIDSKEKELKQLKDKIDTLQSKQVSPSGAQDLKVQRKVEELNKQLNVLKEENGGLIREKNELVKKLFALEAKLKTEFNKEKEELRKSLESSATGGSDSNVSLTKYNELQQLLDKTRNEVQQRIEQEKTKTTQEVEKKFEFKMKMLTRKVEKYEAESKVKPSSQPTSQLTAQETTQPVARPTTQPRVGGFQKNSTFGQSSQAAPVQGVQLQRIAQYQLGQAPVQQSTNHSGFTKTSTFGAGSTTPQTSEPSFTSQPNTHVSQPVGTTGASNKQLPLHKPNDVSTVIQPQVQSQAQPQAQPQAQSKLEASTSNDVSGASKPPTQKVEPKSTEAQATNKEEQEKQTPSVQQQTPSIQQQPQTTTTTTTTITPPITKPAIKKLSIASPIVPGSESALVVKRPEIARTEPRNPKLSEEKQGGSPINERKRSFHDERPKVKKTRQG